MFATWQLMVPGVWCLPSPCLVGSPSLIASLSLSRLAHQTPTLSPSLSSALGLPRSPMPLSSPLYRSSFSPAGLSLPSPCLSSFSFSLRPHLTLQPSPLRALFSQSLYSRSRGKRRLRSRRETLGWKVLERLRAGATRGARAGRPGVHAGARCSGFAPARAAGRSSAPSVRAEGPTAILGEASCYSTLSISGTWHFMPSWSSWPPWGYGTSSSALRKISAVWAICLSTRSIRWGSALPSLAAPRLGPLQPYPSVRFPCLGSPRLSLPLTPTASLLSWPQSTSQPPAVPFSCPLCPVFSVGSLMDGSRSILPAPLGVAPSSSAPFAVPNPEQRRAGPDAPHPRRLSSSLSPNPSSQPSCLNRCSEPSFASHTPKFFPSRPVVECQLLLF